MRWLLSLLILNFYPMALSFEHQRPEIREALFQCRLAMKDYFDLKESASIQEISLDEETLGISLQSADINIIRKISENKKAAVENTFAKNYENQLKICQRKTHDKSEIEDFYRAFKREYRDIDCEAKLVDSNLKPSEVKTLCQGAKYFDLVFFKSENRRPNLILIGETHVMGSGAELAGQQILDTFKLRAVEGYNGKFDSRNLMGVGYEFVMTLAKIGLIGTSNIIRARNNGYYLWSDGDQSEIFFNKNLVSNKPVGLRDAINQARGASVSINLERSRDIREEVAANCKGYSTCYGAVYHRYMIERRSDDMAKTLTSLMPIVYPQKTLIAIVGRLHIPGLSERLKCSLDVLPKLIGRPHMENSWPKDISNKSSCI
ncbi:MAG: hypothetical protein SGJ18_00185 [Pseudomonadota bacterium]|nr:hypothetical protein [Pseudomonadota bacterium]